MRILLFAVLGLAWLGMISWVVPARAAADAQCRIGDTARRVGVRYPENNSKLPCEVVYWENPGQPQTAKVLWRARHTIGFCQSKMDNFVTRLRKQGWSCTSFEQKAWSMPSEPLPEAGPSLAAQEPTFARQTAKAVAGPAVARVDRAALEEELERNLRKLNKISAKLLEGSFATKFGDLGDIDGDGSIDAAVLMTFQPVRAVPSSYLIAYLSDDGTYRPAARAFIGDGDPASAADVRIEDKAIYVVMPAAQPGGPERQTAFVLEEDKLLEVDVQELSSRKPQVPDSGSEIPKAEPAPAAIALQSKLAAPDRKEEKRALDGLAARVPAADPQRAAGPAQDPELTALEPSAARLVLSAHSAEGEVLEEAGEAVFKLELSSASDRPVAVIYSTVDGNAFAGTDYGSRLGILTIEPGMTSSMLRVALMDDEEHEENEKFHLFITSKADQVTMAEKWVSVVIKDDDPA